MSDLKVVPFQKPSHHNLDNDQVIRLLNRLWREPKTAAATVSQ